MSEVSSGTATETLQLFSLFCAVLILYPYSYMTEGNDRKIRENEAQIEDIKREITLSNDARAKIDGLIASLQDELSRANSLRTNISANVRYRNEQKDIEKFRGSWMGLILSRRPRRGRSSISGIRR